MTCARCAGTAHATDQLRTFAGEPRQRSVPVPVDRPDRPIALERPGRPPVQAEPHVAQCARLWFHHRTTARMRRDVHRVRRHQRHQPLPKLRRRLRTESPVPLGPHRWRPVPWSQALRSSDPSTPISPVTRGQQEKCRRSCAGAACEGRMCHKAPSNQGFAGTERIRRLTNRVPTAIGRPARVRPFVISAWRFDAMPFP